jgi:hypothetical protein
MLEIILPRVAGLALFLFAVTNAFERLKNYLIGGFLQNKPLL